MAHARTAPGHPCLTLRIGHCLPGMDAPSVGPPSLPVKSRPQENRAGKGGYFQSSLRHISIGVGQESARAGRSRHSFLADGGDTTSRGHRRNIYKVLCLERSFDPFRKREAFLGIQDWMLNPLRKFVMSPAIQFSTGCRFANASPLFEEEWHPGTTALVPD